MYIHYYHFLGQHDDARMCISIAMTAARLGATVANHVECIEILKTKNEEGKEVASGAVVRDKITGKEWNVKTKCVINATGPHTDFIRLKDAPETKKICQPSSGVHVVLPSYYRYSNMTYLY